MENILLRFKCEECKAVVRPPIFTCTKSHFVCPKCKTHYGKQGVKVKKPKNCEELLDNSASTLIMNIKDYCQYGCGIRTEMGKLEEHEKNCGAFPNSSVCQIEACDWRGVHLISHVTTTHPNDVIDHMHTQRKFELVVQRHGSVGSTKFVVVFDKNSRVNFCYWLKFLGNNNKLLVVMVDANSQRNIDESKTMYQLKNYLISSSNIPLVHSEVVKITSNEKVDANFIRRYGSDISNLFNETILIEVPALKFDAAPQYILDLMKCAKCGQYMSPDAKLCQSGHTVCDKCYAKVKRCQICDSNVLEVKNDFFRKLVHDIKVPCLYSSKGCMENNFNISERMKHELKCMFRDRKCFLCNWSCMNTDFSSHLLSKHVKAKNNEVVNIPIIPNTKLSCIMMYEFDHFFAFQVSFLNDFRFSLSCLDNMTDSYFYDVKFIHCTLPNESISFKSLPCSKNYNDPPNWTIPNDIFYNSVLNCVITIYKKYPL